MSVRALQENDREWVAGLYAANKNLSGAFYWSWQEYWNPKRDPTRHVFLVYEIENTRAAILNYKWMPKYAAWVVKEIAVDVAFKRRGIGKALLELVPKPVVLKTDYDNEESNAFYRGLKFSLMGKEPARNGKVMNVYGKWG